MIGQPTSASIQLIIAQLAEVASSFPTRQWKGNHGSLVLNEAKARAITSITNLSCSPQAQPDATNPENDNGTTG